MRTRLRELKKQHGFTNPQLAEMLGISRRMYVFIEQGKRDPNPQVTNRLEDIFNLPQRELLEQSEEGGN